MSIVDRYLAYADDFEKSYADDDWSRIEQYFTEDAVYEGDPEDASGRAAVIAKLKGGVDGFDRRMDSRRLEFQTPRQDGDAVRVDWTVRYTKAGCPDLALSGEEIAEFEGDRIQRLRDVFDAATEAALGRWMAEHGEALQS